MILEAELFGEARTFGNPWHGPIVNSVVTPPNSAPIPIPGGIKDPQVTYLRLPNRQAIAQSQAEADAGMHFRDDAILFDVERRYSPAAGTQFVFGRDSWRYIAPDGTPFLVRAFMSEVEVNRSLGIDATAQVYVEVWARRDFLSRSPDNSLGRIAIAQVRVSNVFRRPSLNLYLWPSYNVPRPDGAEGVVNLVGFSLLTTHNSVPAGLSASSRAARHLVGAARIALSGGGPGALPSATVSEISGTHPTYSEVAVGAPKVLQVKSAVKRDLSSSTFTDGLGRRHHLGSHEYEVVGVDGLYQDARYQTVCGYAYSPSGDLVKFEHINDLTHSAVGGGDEIGTLRSLSYEWIELPNPPFRETVSFSGDVAIAFSTGLMSTNRAWIRVNGIDCEATETASHSVVSWAVNVVAPHLASAGTYPALEFLQETDRFAEWFVNGVLVQREDFSGSWTHPYLDYSQILRWERCSPTVFAVSEAGFDPGINGYEFRFFRPTSCTGQVLSTPTEGFPSEASAHPPHHMAWVAFDPRSNSFAQGYGNSFV